jgi:Tfp pilus assembly protein PilP
MIAYRFMTGSSDEDKIEPIRIQSLSAVSDIAVEYQYRLNYPDPFLKTPRRFIGATTKKPAVVSKKPMVRQKTIIPKIEVVGIINSDRSLVALIRIQSQTHLMKEGEKINDFLLEKIIDGQIQIKYIPLDSTFVVRQLSKQ